MSYQLNQTMLDDVLTVNTIVEPNTGDFVSYISRIEHTPEQSELEDMFDYYRLHPYIIPSPQLMRLVCKSADTLASFGATDESWLNQMLEDYWDARHPGSDSNFEF